MGVVAKPARSGTRRAAALALLAGACGALLDLDGLRERGPVEPPALSDSGVEATVDGACPAWLGGFAYRVPIPIPNSGQALADYQVRLTVDTASLITTGKMAPDGSDLRVTASDGVTVLSHWFRPSAVSGTAAAIWARVPVVAEEGSFVYLYYGSPGAPSTSDAAATFVEGIIQNPTFVHDGGWTVVGPDNGGYAKIELPAPCPGGCARLSLFRGGDPNGSCVRLCQQASFPEGPAESGYRLVFDMAFWICEHCGSSIERDGDQLWVSKTFGTYEDLETFEGRKNTIRSGELALCLAACADAVFANQSSVVSFANLRVRRYVEADPRGGVPGLEERACP